MSEEGFLEIDEADFLGVMSSFPAGVAVVTALDEGESPRGLTISAFCSVSRRPPLVLVCVDSESNTLPAIRRSGKFTVNFLSEGREQVARAFASKGGDKFAGRAWRPTAAVPGGGPVLHEDTVAHVACVVEHEVEAGDHWVLIGRVVEAAVEDGARALLIHRRGYSGIG